MADLDGRLEETFDDLEVGEKRRQSLVEYLTSIRGTDPKTYRHSVRLGMIAQSAAEHLGLDPKIMFYYGLLHDHIVNHDEAENYHESSRAKHIEQPPALQRVRNGKLLEHADEYRDVLEICDFYDAITHRRKDRNRLGTEESKERMIEGLPHMEETIESLYAARVFR